MKSMKAEIDFVMEKHSLGVVKPSTYSAKLLPNKIDVGSRFKERSAGKNSRLRRNGASGSIKLEFANTIIDTVEKVKKSFSIFSNMTFSCTCKHKRKENTTVFYSSERHKKEF